MMKRVASITYRFVLECNVGILFLFLIYINKNKFPPIPFILLTCIGGMILFAILLVKLREKGKWIYIVTVFPLLLFIYHQADLSVFLGLVIGLFIFWRGISLYDDVFLQSETIVLLISFMVGLIGIVYAALSRYPFQDILIYLLIAQILLVLLGNFYGKWYSIQTDKSKFAIYFVKILAGFSIIGILLTFLLKYAQLIFFNILHVIVLIFSNLIARPLLNALEYLISLLGHKERIPELLGSDMELEAGNYKDRSFGFAEDIFSVLIIIGVIVLIAYLIYKKKLKLQTTAGRSTPRIEIFDALFSMDQPRRLRKRVQPPEEFIRKEIYNLERYAHKLKVGRLSSESIGEWWKRIGLVGGYEIITLYEKVRYGEIQSSLEDQAFIRTEIQKLKQQIKEKFKH